MEATPPTTLPHFCGRCGKTLNDQEPPRMYGAKTVCRQCYLTKVVAKGALLAMLPVVIFLLIIQAIEYGFSCGGIGGIVVAAIWYVSLSW